MFSRVPTYHYTYVTRRLSIQKRERESLSRFKNYILYLSASICFEQRSYSYYYVPIYCFGLRLFQSCGSCANICGLLYILWKSTWNASVHFVNNRRLYYSPSHCSFYVFKAFIPVQHLLYSNDERYRGWAGVAEKGREWVDRREPPWAASPARYPKRGLELQFTWWRVDWGSVAVSQSVPCAPSAKRTDVDGGIRLRNVTVGSRLVFWRKSNEVFSWVSILRNSKEVKTCFSGVREKRGCGHFLSVLRTDKEYCL